LTVNTLKAKRYAKAIFEIASARNELDKMQSDLRKIGEMSQKSALVSVMENPRFPIEAKSRLLNSQMININPAVMNLVILLTGHGLFSLVAAVASEYGLLLDEMKGIEKAEVITAVALEETQKAKLVQQLEAISGKKIKLTLKVEPEILGGMIARVGGKLIDGSTSSQLVSLKNDLANAGR
jgi:F-type H+-transporting ATPase subunit delta